VGCNVHAVHSNTSCDVVLSAATFPHFLHDVLGTRFTPKLAELPLPPDEPPRRPRAIHLLSNPLWLCKVNLPASQIPVTSSCLPITANYLHHFLLPPNQCLICSPPLGYLICQQVQSLTWGSSRRALPNAASLLPALLQLCSRILSIPDGALLQCDDIQRWLRPEAGAADVPQTVPPLHFCTQSLGAAAHPRR